MDDGRAVPWHAVRAPGTPARPCSGDPDGSLPGRGRADTLIVYWGRQGGGSAFTLGLYRHLREVVPHRRLLLSLRADNPELDRFRALGASVSLFRPFAADGSQRALHLLRAYDAQRRLVRHGGFRDIVVAMNSPYCIPFLPVLARSGARIVYVAHDAEPHPGASFPRLQQLAQAALLRIAGDTVALSRHVAARLEAQGVRAPHAIPLAAVIPARDQAATLRGGPLRLLFAGRMVAYKGLDLLHEVLLPLRGDPRWRLTLAGDGPMAREPHRLFADWPQVDLRLRWFGEAEFEGLFAEHDMLLCPYTEASQSGVLAEALAAGMPALVTPEGALSEQIGAGGEMVAGLVADQATPEAFRRILRLVLDSPDRMAAMRHAARMLAAAHRVQSGWPRLLDRALAG